MRKDLENSKKLGVVIGKLWVLKNMIGGFCSDDNPLKIQIDDIEKIVKEIEL
tara:strand:+ start:539 stop:694 length:156 start_codon:yes stop_codon:yes gene_type:complete